MPDVLVAYAISILFVAIVVALAFALGRSISARSGSFLKWVGGILIGIAILEKTGWSVRPWTLGSPAAGFNDLLFRIVFLVGFGLLFVSWTAAPGKS